MENKALENSVAGIFPSTCVYDTHLLQLLSSTSPETQLHTRPCIPDLASFPAWVADRLSHALFCVFLSSLFLSLSLSVHRIPFGRPPGKYIETGSRPWATDKKKAQKSQGLGKETKPRSPSFKQGPSRHPSKLPAKMCGIFACYRYVATSPFAAVLASFLGRRCY